MPDKYRVTRKRPGPPSLEQRPREKSKLGAGVARRTLCVALDQRFKKSPGEQKESGFFWTDSRTGEKGISKCLNKEDIFMLRSQDLRAGYNPTL